MQSVIRWFQKAIADLNVVAQAVGQTVHEIVGSKRALIGAAMVVVPAARQVFPQYAAEIDQVLPFLEGVFALLIVVDTFRPLGVSRGG